MPRVSRASSAGGASGTLPPHAQARPPSLCSPHERPGEGWGGTAVTFPGGSTQEGPKPPQRLPQQWGFLAAGVTGGWQRHGGAAGGPRPPGRQHQAGAGLLQPWRSGSRGAARSQTHGAGRFPVAAAAWHRPPAVAPCGAKSCCGAHAAHPGSGRLSGPGSAPSQRGATGWHLGCVAPPGRILPAPAPRNHLGAPVVKPCPCIPSSPALGLLNPTQHLGSESCPPAVPAPGHPQQEETAPGHPRGSEQAGLGQPGAEEAAEGLCSSPELPGQPERVSSSAGFRPQPRDSPQAAHGALK